MAMLEIRNLSKSYGELNVLRGIDLDVERGEQLVIKGASGSGKSTLLYLIGGLDQADDGEISLDGESLKSLGDDELAMYRNSYVGFVFQFHFLLPSMNSLNNILLPAQIGQKDTTQMKSRVFGLAEKLEVQHCLDKFPYQLSGGEQQRINIIRALSLKPKLLLCDEPTGNLDSKNSHKVVNLLKEASEEVGATLMIVTHDSNVAEQFPRHLSMTDGQLQNS